MQLKGNFMVDEKVTTDVVADDDSDESKTYDAEYVKKLKAEAKSYRQDKAAMKKEYEDTKAKLDALEAAKLTETEKDKKRIAELEKKLIDTEQGIKAKDIDNLIVEAISDKNIIDKNVAKLLIRAELSGEEEINEKVVSKVVDKLIKDKPYLVSTNQVIPSDGNFAKTTGDPIKDANASMVKFLQS